MRFLKLAALLAAAALLCEPPALCVSDGIPTADSSLRIHDFGELLTKSEEAGLGKILSDAKSAAGMDFVVLTLGYDPGMGYVEFCDSFYEENGFGAGPEIDGVMLYVNIVTRDVYVATYGAAVDIIGQSGADSIREGVTPYLTAGGYYDACAEFASLSLERLTARGGADEPYPSPKPVTPSGQARGESWVIFGGAFWLTAAVIAGAGLIILFVLNGAGVSRRPPSAAAYIGGHGVNERRREDIFLRTHTTSVRIQSDSGPGTRGSSGGGSHTTSGGHRAGGSGGKF